MSPARKIELKEQIDKRIDYVNRRTANDSPEDLRVKLVVAELNYENVLDERDYLLSAEWTPVVEDLATEIREARRLSSRLDAMSAIRVQEILSRALETLGKKAPKEPACSTR